MLEEFIWKKIKKFVDFFLFVLSCLFFIIEIGDWMKTAEKWYLIIVFVCIGIFLLLRIYQVLERSDYETVPFFIQGSTPELRESVHLIRLVMVGDALYHDGVYKDGQNSDGSYSFLKHLENIKPIIHGYDLAYYNQESILGGSEMGLSTYPRFNSPYEVGDAFVDAGFNLVSTANNHTLDRGREAVLNSYQYWQSKEGVLMSGSCDSFLCQEHIPVGEKNGISYAFLSYTTSTNGISVPEGEEYLVNVYSEERVSKDIEAVRDQVDVILVAMHWGNEYQDYPVSEQKKIATFLSSLGVHLIIGTHPHVVEPIEYIGDTLVIYSLGNFLSAQTGIDKLVGLLVGVTIEKIEKGDETTIQIYDLHTSLTYTYYNSKFRDFKVYLFDQIDSSILLQKESVEQKKRQLVMSYGAEVAWNT